MPIICNELFVFLLQKNEEADEISYDSENEEVHKISIDSERQMKLREGPVKFLEILRKCLECHDQMDAKYVEIDPENILTDFNLETDSGGIQLHHGEYSILYQQQDTYGNPVESIEDLYTAVEQAKPCFELFLQNLCNEAESTIQLEIATRKGRQRAEEKAKDDFSKRVVAGKTSSPYSWFYDINQTSIKCDETEQIQVVLELLQNNTSVHIVKVKNRLKNSTLTRYRDITFALS